MGVGRGRPGGGRHSAILDPNPMAAGAPQDRGPGRDRLGRDLRGW